MTAAAELIKIDGYHAHVYYDAETRPRASQLRETIAAFAEKLVAEINRVNSGIARCKRAIDNFERRFPKEG